LKEYLTRFIEVGLKLGAEYIEVRAQKLFKTMLTMKDGIIEAAKEGLENGVAIRVLVNGAWGFASVGSFDNAQLIDAVEKTCKMAKAASRKVKTPVELAEIRTFEDKVVVKPRKNPAEVSLAEKIKIASSMNKTVFDYDPRVKSCTMDYLDVTGTNYFINNEGTYIEQDKLYVWSRVLTTAKEGEVYAFAREEIGSTAGFEVFETETLEVVGERIAKRAIEQLKAKTPKGGAFPVVIGPNVVGVFVHEAFGHLAEADLTLKGSVLMDKLGKKIASEVVTVYDDGTVNGAFGSFKYDDEGIPAQKTLLIKDGQVVGLMHNRETAHRFQTSPTGNVRAEDFRYEPIIRMRNTYLAPRDYSFEELLEGVKFGYYLKSFRGGQANLNGTFQVGIQEAYEIVNGEIGAPVRNASISGNTLETLRKVEAVGKDFQLWPGRCGKGQIAFVCDGGPHIRVKEVLMGGGA
jgi:TldD protein